MKHLLFFFCIMTCAGGMAWGDTNYITIYGNNLGLIRHARSVDLVKGKGEIRIVDVATGIIPESVSLRLSRKSGSFSVLEQSYQYDLMSVDDVLDKMIGKPIEFLTSHGRLVQGILLNTFQDFFLIKTDEGIKMLPRDDDRPTINIKEISTELVSRPTLKWNVMNEREGRQQIELTYLTTGLDWHTDYVGILNEKATKMHMNTWVSIRNDSGADFVNAWLALVAGDVNRATGEPSLERRAKMVGAMAVAQHDAGASFEQKEFFEYYVYALHQQVTLNNNDVKQMKLRPDVSVETTPQFIYNYRRSPKAVEARILFHNNKKNGLGEPLPAGIIRVYQEKDGDRIFLGEYRMRHRARNAEVKIPVGKAFDLKGERRIMESRRISDRSERQKVIIELFNNKTKEDVTIIVEENLTHRGWKIEDYSHAFEKIDAQQINFPVTISSESMTKLEYTILYFW